MALNFYVYIHFRANGEPFYIGKGSGYRAYIFTERSQYHKRIVAKDGKENIEVLIFQQDSEAQAFFTEIAWIKTLREAGYKLCNHSIGGNGGTTGTTMSAKTKAKISAALIGNKNTLGHKASIETRQKLSLAHLGNTNGRGCKGKIVSAETRAKMSAARTGIPLSAVHRARLKETHVGMLGKKHSEETKTKMRHPHIKSR